MTAWSMIAMTETPIPGDQDDLYLPKPETEAGSMHC